MSDEDQGGTTEEELYAAFSGAYGKLEREAAALRRQTERQSRILANVLQRERTHRRLIEDQYQLLRARDGARVEEGHKASPVLTIPVSQAMGEEEAEPAAQTGAEEGLDAWLADGAETDALTRPGEPQSSLPSASSHRGAAYRSLRRPPSQAWQASPGLAAFSLPRGELRALGFNLIGAADDRLEHLAEEIAQAAALNRRFAPVIFTTTRAGLNSFRSRRLTYESLPVFSDTIVRLTGIADARSFYDLRVGYLIRKWRIQGVMNLGQGYIFSG